MTHPNIITPVAFLRQQREVTLSDGSPARARGYPSFRNRVRASWMVFTGRADALLWRSA